jgi:hypothetical protein
MATALIGETQGRPGNDRTPINIDGEVREELRNLLYQPFMRGVGYSEFIKRAIDRAYEEADKQGQREKQAAREAVEQNLIPSASPDFIYKPANLRCRSREVVAYLQDHPDDEATQVAILDSLRMGVGGKELAIKFGTILSNIDKNLLTEWIARFPKTKQYQMLVPLREDSSHATRLLDSLASLRKD